MMSSRGASFKRSFEQSRQICVVSDQGDLCGGSGEGTTMTGTEFARDAVILSGWKAIATHLRRNERTAMRWAQQRGMPVHRVPGGRHGPIYAVASEIAEWMASGRTEIVAVPAPRSTTAIEAAHETAELAPIADQRMRMVSSPGRLRRLLATAVTLIAGTAITTEVGMSHRDAQGTSHLPGNPETEPLSLRG